MRYAAAVRREGERGVGLSLTLEPGRAAPGKKVCRFARVTVGRGLCATVTATPSYQRVKIQRL